MPTHVKVSGTWQELTGTDRPYAKVSGNWQGATNIYAKVSGNWQQVYQYDNTGPTVTTPVVAPFSGTQDYVTWSAVTDSESGVLSATVYQTFTGSISGTVAGGFFVMNAPSNGGSYTFTIPNAQRNTPTGETWRVKYHIFATDNAGNTTTGSFTANHYTKPKGTYTYAPVTADSRNIGNTAWNNYTASDEGVVGVSTTKAYGAWFYGTGTFTNDNFTAWDPDSGTIFLKRAGASDPNRGNSGTFSIKMHGSGTKSGAITTIGTTLTQSLSGNDASAYLALDASQLANIGDGDGQGFALTAHSTGVGFLRGLTDYSGLVTLVYS